MGVIVDALLMQAVVAADPANLWIDAVINENVDDVSFLQLGLRV